MRTTLYISGLYALPIPTRTLKIGIYGQGRVVTWVVTDKPVNADRFCIPYNDEPYLYVFTFHEGSDRHCPLGDFMHSYAAMGTLYKSSNESEVLLLSNQQLLHDPVTAGGTLEEVDLS